MIKFEDVLNIARQIEGHSGFNLVAIEYLIDRGMFYAVFRPHISIPITDVNTPLDSYLSSFQDEVQE